MVIALKIWFNREFMDAVFELAGKRKKVDCLTTANRPWHTKQTVEALQKNELTSESELKA